MLSTLIKIIVGDADLASIAITIEGVQGVAGIFVIIAGLVNQLVLVAQLIVEAERKPHRPVLLLAHHATVLMNGFGLF